MIFITSISSFKYTCRQSCVEKSIVDSRDYVNYLVDVYHLLSIATRKRERISVGKLSLLHPTFIECESGNQCVDNYSTRNNIGIHFLDELTRSLPESVVLFDLWRLVWMFAGWWKKQQRSFRNFPTLYEVQQRHCLAGWSNSDSFIAENKIRKKKIIESDEENGLFKKRKRVYGHQRSFECGHRSRWGTCSFSWINFDYRYLFLPPDHKKTFTAWISCLRTCFRDSNATDNGVTRKSFLEGRV